MNKRIFVLLMALILALSVTCFVACDGALEITIEQTTHGTVSSNVGKAETGDEVTLTLTPDSGYYAEKVLVNDVEQQIDGNKCVFVMPNSNADVVVTFSPVKYALNIANVVGGQVTASSSSFEQGAQVTLNVEPAYGYDLQSLTVDGQTVSVTNNVHTFTMPSHDVDVSAAFNTAIKAQELPHGSVVTLKSTAPAGATATADLFLDFGDDSLIVKAYVQDKTIISSKDGVALYFGKNVYANGKVSEANLAIKAFADNSAVIQQGSDNGYVGYDVSGISATVEPWSKQYGEVSGYIVTITATYQTLNVTKDTAQSQLTMLPVLANSDRTGLAFGANESSFDDYYSPANADTYPLVYENGFVDNANMFGQGELGSFKDVVVMGNTWNTERDFGKNSSDYANRIVTLNGHDNADNNIAFTRSSGKTAFVKATFKVTQLFNNNEKYPKFGFMVFDTATANSGVFFYVDAYTDESKNSGIQVTDIIGTELGYASQLNGSWRNWTTISDTTNSFNLSTKQITLSILYNQGIISFYKSTSNGDVLVGGTAYQAQGDIVIGIKSFGLGLEVTNYMATNNPESDEFKSHSAMRGDGQTVGDSTGGFAYTEGWTFFGDIAENTGGGDQVVYIKDVPASANFFAQATATSPSKVGNVYDEYTKMGAVIRNKDYTIFGYVDLEDRTSAENRIVTNFAVRFESGSRAGQWIWEAGVSSQQGTTIEDKEVVLGIAKLGAKVYLTMNGKIVATYTNNDIAEQTFVAGIMGFNRRMMVTKGSGTTDVEQIKAKLGITNDNDSVAFDGVLDDSIWTKEVLDATYTFGENEQTGTKMQIAAVKGSDGVYVALTLYTKTMQRQFAQNVAWSDVSNVEFRLTKMNDNNKTDKNLVQYIAFYNYLDGAVSSSVGFLNAASSLEQVTLKDGQQGYKTTVEFFIPFSYFVGSLATDAELPFYVWTCTFDDNNMPAMNREYNQKVMVVTEHGIEIRDKNL